MNDVLRVGKIGSGFGNERLPQTVFVSTCTSHARQRDKCHWHWQAADKRTEVDSIAAERKVNESELVQLADIFTCDTRRRGRLHFSDNTTHAKLHSSSISTLINQRNLNTKIANQVLDKLWLLPKWTQKRDFVWPQIQIKHTKQKRTVSVMETGPNSWFKRS